MSHGAGVQSPLPDPTAGSGFLLFSLVKRESSFFHIKIQMERLLREASKPWKFLNVAVARLQRTGKHSPERGGSGTWGSIPPPLEMSYTCA